MNNNRSQDQETPVVAGFEVPRSPDASYNNVYTASEDDGRDPPVVPQHLQHTVLSYPTNGGSATPLPDPQHVVLNHLYIENREAPRIDPDARSIAHAELMHSAVRSKLQCRKLMKASCALRTANISFTRSSKASDSDDTPADRFLVVTI